MSDDEELEDEDGEEIEEDGDEEMEDDEELSNVVDGEQLLTRAEEREVRMREAEGLGERLRKIDRDDVKGIVKISKAPTKKERAELKAREEEEAKRKQLEEQEK